MEPLASSRHVTPVVVCDPHGCHQPFRQTVNLKLRQLGFQSYMTKSLGQGSHRVCLTLSEALTLWGG